VWPMAEAFRVDPAALADAVERMGEFQRYAESMLAEIDSLVTNLHATWSGEAAAAHAQAHRHWARGEAMMREALAQLQAAATTAHTNYTGVMAKNLGMWS
jgi:WXG100 family type VII secretion target